MSYIDVPASGKKEYKLNFFAHKDGLTQLRVWWYDIHPCNN